MIRRAVQDNIRTVRQWPGRLVLSSKLPDRGGCIRSARRRESRGAPRRGSVWSKGGFVLGYRRRAQGLFPDHEYVTPARDRRLSLQEQGRRTGRQAKGSGAPRVRQAEA